MQEHSGPNGRRIPALTRRRKASSPHARQAPRSLATASTNAGKQPLSEPGVRIGSRRDVWLAAALVVLVLVAYAPTFTADFVRWDDQFYVTENPLLQEPGGLRAIWNPSDRRAPQFYPLVFTSYWVEFRLWGLDPRGYHAVNVALHTASSLLVLALARGWGFSSWAAALAAAVFALHPVQVASVAWIAERKNTLGGFFFLLAFWCYWRARLHRSNGWYVASFFAFGAGLLSKTQVVALPLSFLLAEWASAQGPSKRQRITFWTEGLVRLLPFFALAGMLALVTVRFEHDRWPPQPFSLLERILIAGNAVGFYATQVIWPEGLSPIYPKWTLDPSALRWWIAPALVLLVGATILWMRHRIPRWILWGVAEFLLGILPVLGLVPFNFFTYSFVADHFLYFSMLGAGAIAAQVAEVCLPRAPRATRAVAAASVLGMSILTFYESTHWRDNLSFWLHVRRRDPDGFLANYNLGLHFRQAGEWERAAAYFRQAARARPNADFVFRRYTEALRAARGNEAVIQACSERIAQDPNFAPAYVERGYSSELLGRFSDARADYERALRTAPPGSAWREQARQRLAALEAPPQPTGP